MPSAQLDAQLAFTQVGNVLSFFSATVMFYVIWSDKNARSQTRPRLLLVLAFLDLATALSKFVAFLPGMHPSGKLLFEIALGDNLSVAAWSWTCCIALHIFLVLKQEIVPNSTTERKWELRYWMFIFVSMFCV